MIGFLLDLSKIIFIFSFLIFLILINHIYQGKIRIDVIPDITDNQVIIYCKYVGQSPQVIQDQIIYKLSTALMGLKGVKSVRGYSMSNFGFVYVILRDEVDFYWARSRIIEKLNTLNLPGEIYLGPDATGVGWAFQYVLISTNKNLSELWDLQNFYIKYRLLSIDGVAEVASVGGFEKEFRIFLDPFKLIQYSIEPTEIARIIANNNLEGSGKYIEIANKQTFIQTSGYINNVNHLMEISLREGIKLKDVGYIVETPSLRMGTADYNGMGEVVGGIVVLRSGTDTYTTLKKIKEEIKKLVLPQGVSLVPVYDRSIFIEQVIRNLIEDIKKEVVVTIIVVSLFLLHLRSSLVISYYMILGALLSIVIFNSMGFTSNIMSLGGIILAIGTMIDAGIVIIENYHRKLALFNKLQVNMPVPYFLKIIYPKQYSMDLRKIFLINSYREVGYPIFLALMIVAVSFLPFLYIGGQAAKLFSPLVITKTIAMIVGSLLAIFLVLPLCNVFIYGKVLEEEKNLVNRFLEKVYSFLFFVFSKIGFLMIFFGLVGWFWFYFYLKSFKTEFMPYLREFSIMYMPTTAVGITISDARKLLILQDKIIKEIYEVESVFGKVGRADTATDPAPLSMIETIITLKPQNQWRKGMTYEKIIKDLDDKLKITGVVNGFTQPIKGRIDMITTGIRTPLGIKIYGPKLEETIKTSIMIEKELQKLDIFSGVYAERIASQPYVYIEFDRKELARRNLSIKEVQEYFDLFFRNEPVSQVIDGLKRYNVSLGFFENQKDYFFEFPFYVKGQIFKISDVAKIRYDFSFSEIKMENGFFVSYVYITPKENIDINYAIDIIEGKIKKFFKEGYSYEYSGDFKYWQEAKENLPWIIIISLFLIFFMVYLVFYNFWEVMMVFYFLPLALIGSLIFLDYFGFRLSIASIAGIVSTMGIAVEMMIVMMIYIRNSLIFTKGNVYERVYNGAVKRLRPKVMTVITLIFSLIPIVLSEGIGSEVLKPIVVPMIGGAISSFLVALFCIPMVYVLLGKKIKKLPYN